MDCNPRLRGELESTNETSETLRRHDKTGVFDGEMISEDLHTREDVSASFASQGLKVDRVAHVGGQLLKPRENRWDVPIWGKGGCWDVPSLLVNRLSDPDYPSFILSPFSLLFMCLR
jgi:hypothetical protein